IERLRIGEVGVGHGSGDGGPIRGEPAAEARRVVASAEVVVARLGVALLALEFVVLRARVRNDALTAKGIEVGVVARSCRSVLHDGTRTAEHIFDVVIHIRSRSSYGK